MDRYFLVTLIDGSQTKMSFQEVIPPGTFIPIGCSPTYPQLLKHAIILSEGFMEPGSETRPKWICGSQIATVEIVVEEPTLKINGN